MVEGIVDFLKKNKIKVFGPNKYAAKLEGSKSFMKLICAQNNIPTANYGIFKNKPFHIFMFDFIPHRVWKIILVKNEYYERKMLRFLMICHASDDSPRYLL